MSDSDFDFEDIRNKLLSGTPAPGAYAPAPAATQPVAPPAPVPEEPESDVISAPAAAPLNPQLVAYLQNKRDMQAAQEKTNTNQLLAGIGRAGSALAHSTYGATTPQDTKSFDALDKAADAPARNIKAQQESGDKAMATQKEMDANDPTSASSIAFRKSLKLVAPNISSVYGDSFDRITAADAPNVMKTAELKGQIDQRKEASEQRAQLANIQMQDRTDRAKTASEDKRSKEHDKMARELKADLDPNGGRAGNMGKNQARVDAAERLDALIKQSGGNPDRRQIEELAIGAQNMLASGNSSVSQVAALVPKSAWGDAKKMYEWFSNDPTGTDQQAFVARMGETIEREKKIAGDQVKTAQIQRLASHHALKQANPELYDNILQGYGIDQANIKGGRYESPENISGGAHPRANEALKWANENPTDPRAQKILERIGKSGQGAPL